MAGVILLWLGSGSCGAGFLFSIDRKIQTTDNNASRINKMNTKEKLLTLALAAGFAGAANGQLIISQYVESDSGTEPRGIELQNQSGASIDFSQDELDVLVGINGGVLTSAFTLNTGILADGDVMVIGTEDIGIYLVSTFGAGVVQFHTEAFDFDGNDSLQVQLGGDIQDTFGDPENNPGPAWTGNGVSTSNQNIRLREDLIPLRERLASEVAEGWKDPSERYITVSNSAGSELADFGVAAVPEPETYGAIAGLLALGLAMVRRRRCV